MADPALLFNDPANRDGTHILLIGVGDYPWLEGGASCTTPERKALAMGLGQLGAPPRSMRALADWYLDGFENQERPLASLAMLLSEPAPAQYSHPKLAQPVTVPRGTISDVKKAVSKWIARANKRRGNGVVFGFCGHGVQSGNPVLLCRDYAKDLNNRFGGAIDFANFQIFLSSKQPNTQLLFVDACRTPDAVASQLGSATPGDALLSGDSLTTRDNAPAMQSLHFATSLYSVAWGRNDQPSLFTQALIDAFQGGGADSDADWWITTSRLHSALATYLDRMSREEGVSQRPVAQTQDFKVSKPRSVVIPLYVESADPAIWAESVTIEALREAIMVQKVAHQPPPSPGFTGPGLHVTIQGRKPKDVTYDVRASFGPASTFLDCSEQVIAMPPQGICELPVSKRP